MYVYLLYQIGEGWLYVLWCLERTWCCLCVGYMYSEMLGAHLVQEGVALVKFQPFPSPMELQDIICILQDMYALTCNKVIYLKKSF